MHRLTAEEAQRLLETGCGHRLEALFTLALTTGMRRGELLALQWNDIDWHNGSLQVYRSLHLVGKVSAPKTAAAQRTIVLSAVVLEVLQEHRKRQDAERSHAGAAWTDRDLIFSTLSGNLLTPQHLTVSFHELVQEAQLPPMRFHDLRQSASRLVFNEKGECDSR